jgi:hypothetical protein
MDKRKNSSDVRTRQALHAFHPFRAMMNAQKMNHLPIEHTIKLKHIRLFEKYFYTARNPSGLLHLNFVFC